MPGQSYPTDLLFLVMTVSRAWWPVAVRRQGLSLENQRLWQSRPAAGLTFT